MLAGSFVHICFWLVLFPLGDLRYLVSAGAGVGTLWYHLCAPGRYFPGRNVSFQARPDLAHGRLGILHFGAVVGSGTLTKMTSPAVSTSLSLGSLGTVGFAALHGAMFGVGRSSVVLWAPVSPRTWNGRLSDIVLVLPARLQPAGVTVGALGTLVVVLNWQVV